MKYTSEQISQINNAISIVEYAKKYLDLEYRGNEYWTVCPFHNDNDASLSFNAEKNVYKCFGCDSKGSLINFVMQYHKLTFPKAIEHILQLVNINIEPKEPSEICEYLHKINRKKCNKQTRMHIYLPEDIMEQYAKESIKEWLKEGISQEILDKYNVRYNKSGNAIVFPIKDKEGNILAIKARTLFPNYKDIGITKYIYYQSIGTNDFLFGLYNNINNIKNSNECLIIEAEKGVMKLDSWGFNNVVALSTKHISDAQTKLLLSLKTDLVFAFDKDVVLNDIIKEIKHFKLFTNVFYIYDKENLLSEKDSPYDKGKDVWNKLYNSKIKL